MTNDLLKYWQENRQSMDGYKVLHVEHEKVIILCFEEIREEDKTWTDSWLEEVNRHYSGKHYIYTFQKRQILPF